MMGSQNQYESLSRRIAVWGPSRSGKTWLINAFCRSLMNGYAHDQNFSYNLNEYTGEKNEAPVMPFKPPRYEKTFDPVDFIWMFQRRPLQTSYGHQISANMHILHIQDINGDDAFQLTDEIKQSLMGVNFLLLLLDPMCFGDDKDADDETQGVGIINQETYYYSVLQLLFFLGQMDTSRLNIAVCLTKKDLWGSKLRQDTVIREKFGQQMDDLIKVNSLRFRLKTFATTSCGYLPDDRGEPNFNPKTGLLKNDANWKPEGVVSPFFWFLEDVELMKLGKANGFFEKLTLRSRTKKYIPYPDY